MSSALTANQQLHLSNTSLQLYLHLKPELCLGTCPGLVLLAPQRPLLFFDIYNSLCNFKISYLCLAMLPFLTSLSFKHKNSMATNTFTFIVFNMSCLLSLVCHGTSIFSVFLCHYDTPTQSQNWVGLFSLGCFTAIILSFCLKFNQNLCAIEIVHLQGPAL